MTIWDDRILEVVRDEGATPVGKITENDGIRISQPSVSRRCQKLADNGLLRPIGNGVYAITDEGEAYLKGEYDAENGAFMNGGEVNNGPAAGEPSDI
ncbi:PhiH1 repressor [Natranaeroarchaeum aerophilus]|uniref:PhiH1 repressor n=2 Tax=Natranaeroarchaeum aerophilus TaxID=2917711 RepID=A0AAE3K669_9EURY|nr:PhiH1 repressor [Natranaeroarchaeum aerophilus]MCL9812504.1 PhiH1 repressor [Natranaeroarchaeum aerophilus]